MNKDWGLRPVAAPRGETIMLKRPIRTRLAPLVASALLCSGASTAIAQAQAQGAPAALASAPAVNPIEADGTVHVPGFPLPPSIYLSPEARAALPRRPTDMEAPMMQALAAGKAPEMRARIGAFIAPKIKHY